MDPWDYTLEVREAFSYASEFFFKRGMVKNILNRIQPAQILISTVVFDISMNTYRALMSATSRRGMHNQIRKRRFPNKQ